MRGSYVVHSSDDIQTRIRTHECRAIAAPRVEHLLAGLFGKFHIAESIFHSQIRLAQGFVTGTDQPLCVLLNPF